MTVRAEQEGPPSVSLVGDRRFAVRLWQGGLCPPGWVG